MFPTHNLNTTLTDSNDDTPVAYDADQNEIYHGDITVKYEGREIVWEAFRDKVAALIEDEAGALTLARALDLDITRYR